MFYFTVLLFFFLPSFFRELVLVQAGVCNADAETSKRPDVLHVQFYEGGIASVLVFPASPPILVGFFRLFFFSFWS